MRSSYGLPLNSWLGDNSARLVFISVTHYAETNIYIGGGGYAPHRAPVLALITKEVYTISHKILSVLPTFYSVNGYKPKCGNARPRYVPCSMQIDSLMQIGGCSIEAVLGRSVEPLGNISD